MSRAPAQLEVAAGRGWDTGLPVTVPRPAQPAKDHRLSWKEAAGRGRGSPVALPAWPHLSRVRGCGQGWTRGVHPRPPLPPPALSPGHAGPCLHGIRNKCGVLSGPSILARSAFPAGGVQGRERTCVRASLHMGPLARVHSPGNLPPRSSSGQEAREPPMWGRASAPAGRWGPPVAPDALSPRTPAPHSPCF